MKILFQVWAAFVSLWAFLFVLFPLGILAATVSKDYKTRLKIVSPGWRIFGFSIMRVAALSKVYLRDDRSDYLRQVISPALYISNHQSMMDIPLILSQFALPPIMKKEIMKVPLFGIVAKASGAMPVDRKDRNSRANILKTSFKRMLDGFPVQYYPEGTRSKDANPKPYEDVKMKLVAYAYENNIPVVCMSVSGTRKLLSKNGVIRPFQKVGFIINKEIYPKDYQSNEEFCRASWDLVNRSFEELEEITS